MKKLSINYYYFSLLVLLTGLAAGCGEDNPVDPGKKSEGLECINGMAGQYSCQNIDLLAHIETEEFQGDSLRLNDIWGWTDPMTGKEYALVGLIDGVSFVDISNPEEPKIIGKLVESIDSDAASTVHKKLHEDHEGHKSSWRDFKVYKNHLFVVSDAQPHGLQVFDLTRLRNVNDPPAIFNEDVLYNEFGPAHNIAINRQTGFAYVVGSDTYGGGLHIVNIQNPLQPVFAGAHTDTAVGLSSRGYVHDTECVIYQGSDTDYQGEEICFNSSETHFVIADVSEKDSTYTIAKSEYEGVEYAHQGWLTEDHNYFLMDDELDEIFGARNTRTIIWDVRDLDNPEVIGIYEAATRTTDHNLYIKGNRVYQANYQSGLRILSLENVEQGQLTEMAYFDTFPQGDEAGTDGAWSNYPFFESGVVIVSDISNGLFILKPNL